VEVAIKMAMQYWMSKGKVSRTRLISLQHAYHGDTFAAMSVCDPVNGMHDKFAGLLLDVHFLPAPAAGFGLPHDENQIAELRAYLEKEHSHCAALILEPIVQGAGGMRFYSPDYLKAVREVCSEFGILLIADEIATGFGRTGKLFACEHAGINPDIMCVGKALTGGYMSLAATLCTNEVSRSISMHNTPLMHVPTFMANPLACACAIASIELLLESPWQERIEAISEQLENGLAACRQEESVEDVRVLGAIGVVEMKQEVDMAAAQAFFVSKGVWIRPFGRLIYVMPPYLIDGKSLQKLADAILEFTRTLAIR
jgi:adenosylmethionine-8-amino-7-oxononanoate aminotransferase